MIVSRQKGISSTGTVRMLHICTYHLLAQRSMIPVASSPNNQSQSVSSIPRLNSFARQKQSSHSSNVETKEGLQNENLPVRAVRSISKSESSLSDASVSVYNNSKISKLLLYSICDNRHRLRASRDQHCNVRGTAQVLSTGGASR